jgi:transcriptional regulator with XRE-family HTH domain
MNRQPTTFADRLRSLRENAGLTPYALAKKSGLTKQAVYRLEAGTRDPAWETVQRLALALHVSCETFVDPALTLPANEPARPPGRPRKAPASGKASGEKKQPRT